MDFGLNESEEMIRASAQAFLVREGGPSLARDGDADAFWQQVSEMGWPGIAVSERFGGAEMGLETLGVLMEQWGANLGNGPLFESSVLAAPLLESAASDRLNAEILPRIADGSATAAIAVIEQSASWRPEDVRATAVRTGEGWALTGAKHFVANAGSAQHIITAARTGEGPGDVTLFLVDSSAEGISREPLKHAGGDPVFVLRLNETPVQEGRLIGSTGGGWPHVEQLLLHGAAFRSLQLAGLGRRVLEITIAYVKERRQFGVPIGSFQAIQHHLADMAVSVRRVELLARRGAWCLANETGDRKRHVAVGKHAASELIPQVCWTAHQCHGAIGFTWEHDLHLYTRRALSWAAEYGDAAWHADLIASKLDPGPGNQHTE